MKDLKGKAVRGGVVKVCAQILNFILRVGSLVVLARLLEPSDFGLVGMVTAVTGVFSLFKDAGLSMATVQRAVITDEEISSLFWINILVGAILALVSIVGAPLLVAFYKEPRLFWVTVAIASGFLLNAAGVQHAALLQREMRFIALAIIEIISLLASIAIGITMAVNGCGYWSLVGMAVILPAAYTVCSWLASTWKPGMPGKRVGVSSMLRFGGTITLNNIIVYAAYNFDKVLLGRYWGADALGIYGRAYQLINIPADNLYTAIGGVAYSALSRLQDDLDRLKSYFIKGYSLVLSMSLPITVACALFADDIIYIFLGPKWMDAVTIFRLLAPTVLVFALINPLSWLLFSLGLINRSLKMALVIAPLVITAYSIGLPYGPNGVAIGYSVMLLLLTIPLIAWAIHGTTISMRDICRTAGPPIISIIIAAVPALAVNIYCGQTIAPLPRLALGCTVLFISYLWLLFYVMQQKEFYLTIVKQLRLQSSQGEGRSSQTV
jgi:O-antigen/teichoic acid export membrane protein